jgi:hypothetical protein
MIDPGTAQRSPNAGRSPEKLRLRHLAARANPRSGPFGLAERAGTEQGRLRKPASGESRIRPSVAIRSCVGAVSRGRWVSKTTIVPLSLAGRTFGIGSQAPGARMSEPPTVTIGMPVYNGEALLARSIPSILEQTYRDFELVICDDASRDGTEALCRRFAAEDPRIRYRRNITNLGGSANFNQTFFLARGRYFKWCAQDDVILPTFLQAAVEVLEAHPDVVLCHARTRIVDSNLETLVRINPGAYGAGGPQAWRRFAGGCAPNAVSSSTA